MAMNATELVLLHIGPRLLALPRREVRDLLAPDDLAFEVDADRVRASIGFGDSRIPALVLDDAMQLARTLPAGRRICVVLNDGATQFAVACDEFEHKVGAAVGTTLLHELPPALRGAGSPVTAVLQIGEAVAAVTDTQSLLRVFATQLNPVVEFA